MEMVDTRMWPRGLVAMIPALGAGGPGFKSRLGPSFCPLLQLRMLIEILCDFFPFKKYLLN